MTAWRPLSDLIRAMRRAGMDHLPALGLRERAAALAIGTEGLASVVEYQGLVNCAALALSMPRLVVHRVSPGAARMVHETDLHSLPGEPPRLLAGPWLLEARSPDEPLFGDTASLGGYGLDGAMYLIGFGYPAGMNVARWTPRWREEELSAGITRDESPLIDDADAHQVWAREAARFAVVLGLLLEAEGSPVQVEEETPKGRKTRAGHGGVRESEWTVRRVYLGRITPSRERETDRPATSGDGTTGRQSATVPVRGHIKRQPYGPGRSLRRWVYIQGYEARRWIAPRPLRIDINE